MDYTIEDSFVYRSYKTDNSSIKQMVGNEVYSADEIISDTQTDIVTYTFSLIDNIYHETSRTQKV